MSRINWENPPSRRTVQDHLVQHLIFDFVVTAAALFAAQILWRAMHGATDASARGVREYFVQTQTGSGFLVWAVLIVFLLAASYAIIDAALAIFRHRDNARRHALALDEIVTQEEETT